MSNEKHQTLNTKHQTSNFKLQTIFLTKPAGHVQGVIGDDDIGTSPFHGQKRFQYDTLFVDPAVPGGGLDHGVFAADVVDGNRAVDAVPGLTDDIEVGHGWV